MSPNLFLKFLMDVCSICRCHATKVWRLGISHVVEGNTNTAGNLESYLQRYVAKCMECLHFRFLVFLLLKRSYIYQVLKFLYHVRCGDVVVITSFFLNCVLLGQNEFIKYYHFNMITLTALMSEIFIFH